MWVFVSPSEEQIVTEHRCLLSTRKHKNRVFFTALSCSPAFNTIAESCASQVQLAAVSVAEAAGRGKARLRG